MTRIFEPSELKIHSTLELNENAAHHLARVLRSKIGEQIILFNGRGGEYLAEITKIDKKGVAVRILSFNEKNVESPINIHLAQGIARGEKMDFIIQKAIELGVTHITPLITTRSNVRLDNERSEKRLAHWRAVAISACEQSGRTIVPEIFATTTLDKYLDKAEADLRFVLTPHTQEKLPQHSSSIKNIHILIGPEGGLDEIEIKTALNKGFLALSLGPRILRTETASIAAISVLQTKFGDFL